MDHVATMTEQAVYAALARVLKRPYPGRPDQARSKLREFFRLGMTDGH